MLKDKTYYEQEASYEEYLEWYMASDKPTYEKPSVTNDSIILAWDSESKSLKFLAIKRKAHPFRGKWALPGGFMEIDETVEESVVREVKEETHVDVPLKDIEQLGTFSTVDRDPRMRILTVAHLVYLPNTEGLPLSNFNAYPGDDAKDLSWLTISLESDGSLSIKENDQEIAKEDFAFDHYEILTVGMNRIKGRLDYNPTVLQVLPTYFTATQARLLFGTFIPKLKAAPNSANFITTYGKFFEETQPKEVKPSVGRPARYYKFK